MINSTKKTQIEFNNPVDTCPISSVKFLKISDEFIFLTDGAFEDQLHNPEYLNIALFNAMYWEH